MKAVTTTVGKKNGISEAFTSLLKNKQTSENTGRNNISGLGKVGEGREGGSRR